jgi:hypothetical protein
LPLLEQLVGDDGSPRRLHEHFTIEVPVEPGPRSRPSDADEEILTLCAELPQLTGAAVTLITGDTGMRLRARAQGTAVATIPDNTYAALKATRRSGPITEDSRRARLDQPHARAEAVAPVQSRL